MVILNKFYFLEKILLSDTIIKINRFNFSQSRFLVLTDKAIYNFQKKSKNSFLKIKISK